MLLFSFFVGLFCVHCFTQPHPQLKPPYLQNLDDGTDDWIIGGSATISEKNIRLTPLDKGKYGSVWHNIPNNLQNWEMNFEFFIGQGSRSGGDGMAFWYVEKPNSPGSVYGSQDKWKGLSVIFDTYDNDHRGNNPYILAIVNDGTLSYDHDNDGITQLLGGGQCQFRNPGTAARARVVYENKTLMVQIDNGMRGSGVKIPSDWEQGVGDNISEQLGVVNPLIQLKSTAFQTVMIVHEIELPTGYHFGFTAATGDVTDVHEINQAYVTEVIHHIPKRTDAVPTKADDLSAENPKESKLRGFPLLNWNTPIRSSLGQSSQQNSSQPAAAPHEEAPQQTQPPQQPPQQQPQADAAPASAQPQTNKPDQTPQNPQPSQPTQPTQPSQPSQAPQSPQVEELKNPQQQSTSTPSSPTPQQAQPQTPQTQPAKPEASDKALNDAASSIAALQKKIDALESAIADKERLLQRMVQQAPQSSQNPQSQQTANVAMTRAQFIQNAEMLKKTIEEKKKALEAELTAKLKSSISSAVSSSLTSFIASNTFAPNTTAQSKDKVVSYKAFEEKVTKLCVSSVEAKNKEIKTAVDAILDGTRGSLRKSMDSQMKILNSAVEDEMSKAIKDTEEKNAELQKSLNSLLAATEGDGKKSKLGRNLFYTIISCEVLVAVYLLAHTRKRDKHIRSLSR